MDAKQLYDKQVKEEKEAELAKEAEKLKNIDAKADNLITALKSIQQQYVYYILAITAACIGFTINSTQNTILDITLLPAGIALLFWFLSFVCGILQIHSIEKHTIHNIISLDNAKSFGKNPKSKQIDDKLIKIMESFNKKGKYYRKLQMILLVAALFFYLFWHIEKLVIYTHQQTEIKSKEIKKP